MAGPPIGTVTFVLTDIERSTALLQRLGDSRYAEALSDQRRIIRAAFAEHGGWEIDTAGDSLLMAFPRASDAIAGAVAAQQALRRHPWPENMVLEVRMGLHTGEPIAVSGEYVGLDLHRAARISQAAHGGQILLSSATASLVEGNLPAGVGLRSLGAHRLKDLEMPFKLFQVLHPDLRAVFPPIRSLGGAVDNLPVEVSTFIGRERERTEVHRLLSSGRLVTLIGAGGCGKTRLALQVAADALEAYPDGVWLVELAALTDPGLVPQAVALAIGLREVPGRELLATLVDHLRSMHLLLVLDNCEHLVEACAQITVALLSACENIRVLATSREPLGISGEIASRVPSLSLAEFGGPADMETLARSEAVQLFVERARAVQSTFALTPQNARAVADVSRHLDGIPLAIELAAARVAVLPVEQIAARLSDRFSLLTEGRRSALPRHRTLRAAMDWGYNLLSEPEQMLLRRLSVFAGGWTLEAAEAVCADPGSGGFYILDLLSHLVLKSLVLADEQRGEMRYRSLETVRQYGLIRLVDSSEVADVKSRHLKWCLALVEQAAPQLVGAAQAMWFDRLEAEHDNIRAALEWSLQSGQTEAGLRLMGAIWRFWFHRAHFAEGRGWLEALLRADADAEPRVRAEALKAAGNLAVWGHVDLASGRAFYDESLALFRGIDDRRSVATVLGNMAYVAASGGEIETERTLLEESLALRREIGDKWGIALALNNLGRAAFRRGDHAQALALISESLPIWRELEDRESIGMALRNLGRVAVHQADYARARALFADSLAIMCELGHKYGIAYQLEGSASLAAAEGQAARAARLLGAAEALREAIGAPLLPPDLPDYQQTVAAVRSSLAAEMFAEHWAKGRALTLEEAVDEARSNGQEIR